MSDEAEPWYDEDSLREWYPELVRENAALRTALKALYDATEPLDREWVYERLNELQGDIFDAARERAGVVLGGGNDG